MAYASGAYGKTVYAGLLTIAAIHDCARAVDDHVDRARKRLTYRWRSKPIMVSIVESLARQSQSVEDVLCEMRLDRSLARATGVQLDAVGAILGTTRGTLWGESDVQFRERLAYHISRNVSDGELDRLIDIARGIAASTWIEARENYDVPIVVSPVLSLSTDRVSVLKTSIPTIYAGDYANGQIYIYEGIGRGSLRTIDGTGALSDGLYWTFFVTEDFAAAPYLSGCIIHRDGRGGASYSLTFDGSSYNDGELYRLIKSATAAGIGTGYTLAPAAPFAMAYGALVDEIYATASSTINTLDVAKILIPSVSAGDLAGGGVCFYTGAGLTGVNRIFDGTGAVSNGAVWTFTPTVAFPFAPGLANYMTLHEAHPHGGLGFGAGELARLITS